MLVHVQSQDGDGASDALGIIGGALIEQAAIPRYVCEENPPSITGQSLGERDKLQSPAVDRAEVSGDRIRNNFQAFRPSK